MTRPPPAESCKVYTPRPLAKAMVRALAGGGKETWLEPSAGRGVFIEVLSDAGVPRSRITAIDLDHHKSSVDALAATYRGVDFLSWSVSIPHRFDRVIGNPPYIPISRLDHDLRRSATMVRVPGGRSTVPAKANTWYAFLSASLHLLKRNGGIAFILPAGWEYTTYAQPLRSCLPSLFAEVYCLRCRTPLFDSVQEGSVVLVCKGYEGGPASVRRIECSGRDELIAALLSLGNNAACPVGDVRQASCAHLSDGCRLGDVIEVGIGGVTGDADYFLLTEKRRLSLGLPSRSLRPVLSRCRHLRAARVTQQVWEDMCARGERVWLFCPPEHLLEHPAVAAYLSFGYGSAGCDRNRYKIQNRSPWYRTPLPRRIDGFISGMSSLGPWIAFRDMPGLAATNTLYTVRFRQRLTDDEKCSFALALLTGAAREGLSIACRIYADGLRKHEPRDLMDLRIPEPTRSRGAQTIYSKAVDLLFEDRPMDAMAMADDFVL